MRLGPARPVREAPPAQKEEEARTRADPPGRPLHGLPQLRRGLPEDARGDLRGGRDGRPARGGPHPARGDQARDGGARDALLRRDQAGGPLPAPGGPAPRADELPPRRGIEATARREGTGFGAQKVALRRRPRGLPTIRRRQAGAH